MNITRGPGQSPKYQRLAADLRRRIVADEWLGGAALPVESELGVQYARNPVRLAVDLLVNEGLPVRVQGKGTFLKDGSVPDHHACADRSRLVHGLGDVTSRSAAGPRRPAPRNRLRSALP